MCPGEAHESSSPKLLKKNCPIPHDSPCFSNQQQPSPSSFIYSACVASTIPFSNLTNTEFYNLLSFDNSDLSNFIESFACDLPLQHYQTKYSTLSDTSKINHANKPENLSYFHFNVRSLRKNKHKLDDFFLMTEVNCTFIAISETKLKPNFIVNIDIPGFNFVHNCSKSIPQDLNKALFSKREQK